MKAEINSENKARFFALYWGQRILITRIGNSCLWGEIIDDVSDNMEDCMIELKPLSSISDEDAIEVAKYFGVKESDFWTDQFSKYRTGEWYSKKDDVVYHFDKVGKDICQMICETGSFSKKVWYKHESCIAIVFDFLRSRGYALPWMGLSVEELQQAGWIKLIEQ